MKNEKKSFIISLKNAGKISEEGKTVNKNGKNRLYWQNGEKIWENRKEKTRINRKNRKSQKKYCIKCIFNLKFSLFSCKISSWTKIYLREEF